MLEASIPPLTRQYFSFELFSLVAALTQSFVILIGLSKTWCGLMPLRDGGERYARATEILLSLCR